MPTLLFYGDNRLELDEALHTLRDRLDEVDAVSLDPDVALSELAAASQTAGLFAARRLITVRGLHKRWRTITDEVAADLRPVLENVAETTTLLLREDGMRGDHALVRVVRQAGGEARGFSIPRPTSLPAWLIKRAANQGAQLDPAAAQLLVDLAGDDPTLLSSELEKLITYSAGETVDSAAVSRLVGATPRDSIFKLIDSVYLGEAKSALRLLTEQREATSSDAVGFALYLVRMMARQTRILLQLRFAQEAGRSPRQAADDLHLPSFAQGRYLQQAERFTVDRLAGGLEDLAALEHVLKTGRVEPAAGLDLLVAELVTGSRAGAR
ncbi:MAG: DNA polymerase III subunit delta [Chloroflexota bacterium]